MKINKPIHKDFFDVIETVGVTKKNCSESVIVRVVKAHKKLCLDLRVFKEVPGTEGGSVYSKKGLCLRPHVAQELIRLLEEGLRRLPQTAEQEKDAPADV